MHACCKNSSGEHPVTSIFQIGCAEMIPSGTILFANDWEERVLSGLDEQNVTLRQVYIFEF